MESKGPVGVRRQLDCRSTAQDHSIDRSRPYLSCEWIESGLAFNRRGLHACLIVHHGRGFPKLCDFEGGEVPWDRVEAARAEIIRANQNGGHPDCAGCPYLVYRSWPEPRHDVERVGVANFARCNIYCNYCFLQTQDPASYKDGLDPYDVGPAITALIRDGRLAPDATFDWGGGEPTIYPEFDSILEQVTRRGATTWVHTNAVRFPRPFARGLSGERIGIICSVDAGFRETYERMKGRDLLDQVWRTLTRYIDAGCDVHVKYIVKDENCSPDELKAFVARAAEADVKNLIVDTDYNYPEPSDDVLAGLRLLSALGPAHGVHTSFGATGALFAPESNDARQAWEQAQRDAAASPAPEPGPIRRVARVGRTVQRRLFDALRRRRDRDLHVIKPASAVTLTATRFDADDVFSVLRGYVVQPVPVDVIGGLQPFGGADPDVIAEARPTVTMREVTHGVSAALVTAVALDPCLTDLPNVSETLVQSFATSVGPAEVDVFEGESVYRGQRDGALDWIVFQRYNMFVGIHGRDRAFVDGVARRLLKHLR